ncbi:hypothetical protein H1C71_025632 [Ictidomys tridecemlineatus]|uniref:uncharacterized protein LOC101967141 isoform X2 n=1 Tax=Ictidomys tridecemlineatus TaxID=43179 RepID=UPI000682F3EB|nr:uncharacterized protein LOC101967141 isoform X2 [Ictidomys tridecemlineatus]KAG3289299.1 hypothetical protein H1C71_025632 [Ictidomys tridecemlineatus]
MHSGPALVNKWLCDLGWGILLSVNPALICPPPLSYPPRITKNLSEVGPLLLATLVSLALQQHSWVQLDVSISNLPETWRLARPWNTLSAMELDGQDCSSWAQLDSWPAGLPAAPHLLPRGKFLTRWTTPALEDLPSSLGRAEARQRPDSKATIPALCVPGAPRGRGPCCRRLAAPPPNTLEPGVGCRDRALLKRGGRGGAPVEYVTPAPLAARSSYQDRDPSPRVPSLPLLPALAAGRPCHHTCASTHSDTRAPPRHP